MAQKYSKIIEALGRNRVRQAEPLSGHTTFRIGGPADLFFEAKTTNDLVAAVKLCHEKKVKYFIFGGGSNLLVNDKGLRGIVIKIRNTKYVIRDTKIIAGAGMSLGDLVKKTAQLGLSGLEFAAGIPGFLGGAVRGNAGAWQKSIGDRIVRVRVLTDKGNIEWISGKDCQFAYRQSRFKKTKEVILEAELVLEKKDKKIIKKEIEDNLAKRADQPKEPSAGCVFINPTSCSAGRLIEQCGLKGKRIGDAQISVKHANFIVNLEKAKAEDVVKLINLAKVEVAKKFGIYLKEEIYLLGFDRIY